MPNDENVAKLLREWIETITIRSLYKWWGYYRTTGLSVAQFGVLTFLYHGGTCSVSAIGQRMEVSGAAASQLIERLVQAGLVERSENPADRRARRIVLTAKGREVVERGIAERYRWLDELVANLDEPRRRAVLAALLLLVQAEQKLPASALEPPGGEPQRSEPVQVGTE